MLDRLPLICLGVFCTLFGILTVTNLEVVWSRPIMGFSALVAEVVCLVRGIR